MTSRRVSGGGVSLGRPFAWLWAAFTVSTFGTWLAFDAFPILAVTVLHAGAGQVSLLAAAGTAVGAVLAVPLGPWVEFRPKRPVMIGMDLVRFAAMLSVPAAYALGLLTFGQLVVVAVIAAAADIAFNAASGAFVKGLVPRRDLLTATGRFESTTWTATMVGPPLGGAAIGLLGPVASVAANAASFLLSALGVRAIRHEETRQARQTPQTPHTPQTPQTPPTGAPGRRLRLGDLLEGWRFILTHPGLRPLFLNVALFNGLLMATSPLLAVLMLGPLGFAPWQYGLAFALPCVGGLVGSRLARRLAPRHGRHRVLVLSGVLRVLWPVGLAFVGPGVPGLLLVMGLQVCLVTFCGIFNPVLAAHRLELTPDDRVARTLSAWSVSTKLSTATLTALWGLLAQLIGTSTAIGAAGVLLLGTPLLLLRRARSVPGPVPDAVSASAGAATEAADQA